MRVAGVGLSVLAVSQWLGYSHLVVRMGLVAPVLGVRWMRWCLRPSRRSSWSSTSRAGSWSSTVRRRSCGILQRGGLRSLVWEAGLIARQQESGFRETVAGLNAGKFPSRYESHWATKDGRRRLLSWRNSAVLGDHGEVTHVVATAVDVTASVASRRSVAPARSASGQRSGRCSTRSSSSHRSVVMAARSSIFAMSTSTTPTASWSGSTASSCSGTESGSCFPTIRAASDSRSTAGWP